MKKIIFNIAAIVTLFSSQHALASSFCPPRSMVEHLDFYVAMRKGDGWGLGAQEFSYQGNIWGIMLYADLKDAKNETEALEQGREFFKTIHIFSPINFFNVGCLYGGNPVKLNYAVIGFPMGADENAVKSRLGLS